MTMAIPTILGLKVLRLTIPHKHLFNRTVYDNRGDNDVRGCQKL